MGWESPPVSDGVLVRLATEDLLVRKNAIFTHDRIKFGHDVSGKRFNTHGTRGAPHWRMFVPGKNEKSTSENRSAFLGVGAEGVEPPTLCL